MSSVQEWRSVRRDHKGTNTTVTVTLVDGHDAVRWSVKTFRGQIKESVAEARKVAFEVLTELKEAADG